MKFNLEVESLTGRSAHIWQRLSAIYLMFYIPFLAVVILQLPASSNLTELTQNLLNFSLSSAFAVTSVFALALMLVHAWVGVRDIIIDYAPRQYVKLWLTLYHSLLALVLINCTLITISVFGYA